MSKISKSGIRDLLKEHVRMLRQESKSDFPSIYDFEVYNNLVVEDFRIFEKIVDKGSRVLDLGCGRGTTSYVLCKQGYETVGLEVSYEDLDPNLTSYVFPEGEQEPLWDETRKMCASGSLDFNFYDGLEMPLDKGSFDAVFAYAVLEHVEGLELTLKEIKRVLKPGGTLFVSRTPNKFSALENLAKVFNIPAHENTYTEEEIREYLETAGFEIKFLKVVDFFPSNIPIEQLNDFYQSRYKPIMFLEKVLRKTPLSFFAHHYRIIAFKK